MHHPLWQGAAAAELEAAAEGLEKYVMTKVGEGQGGGGP